MLRRNRLALSLIALVAGAAACTDKAPDARMAWIQSGLCRDLQATLVRDPSAVADKLELMAEEPFIYFRGSLALWHADTNDADGRLLDPSVVAVPEADWILLVGDPHPENAGTFRVPGPGRAQAAPGDGGRMTIEWNDFDAATWGPWLHDLRRLATGVELVWEEAPVSDEDRARAVEAVVAGYLEGLARPDADAADPAASLPRFAADLVARAEVAGGDRTELRALDADERRTSFVEDDRFVAPDAAELALVHGLLAAWAPKAAMLEGLPKGLRAAIASGNASAIARRLGVGIASFALRRFDVWFAAGESDPESDPESDAEPDGEGEPESDPAGNAEAPLPSAPGLMIEFKEVAPAPAWELPAAYANRAFASPAARSVFAEEALQREPRGDALLAAVVGPDASFRVRERTAYQKGFERERLWNGLTDGTLTAEDATQFARYLGRLLGAAHARAPRLAGGTAQAALLAHLTDPATAQVFTHETRAFAERMAAVTRSDRATLRQLIRDEGALIGCPH